MAINQDINIENIETAERAFFERFLSEVTPAEDFTVFAANGAALIFASINGGEFDAMRKKAKPFIELVVNEVKCPKEWAPYRTNDGGALFKLFVMAETMRGWHADSRVFGPDGSIVAEDDDIPKGSERRPYGPLLPKFGQLDWLKFRFLSPVAYAAVEAQVLQSLAVSDDARFSREVMEQGEDSSATS